MKKIDETTMDAVAEAREGLLKLFPECADERAGIDLAKLRDLLGMAADENRAVERYTFTWPGKRAAQAAASAPVTETLAPCREESKDFDSTQNLYIEGDNLTALKIIEKHYIGKIKMIYIDPPYNTGKDFVYRDHFSISEEERAQKAGEINDRGDRYEKNDGAGARYHSNWCSMIYPRLRLARNLLSDDGVIFISIDDNEVTNLRKICDEIFGEDNFVACLVWQSTPGSNTGNDIKTVTENIVLYCKNQTLCKFNTQPIADMEKYSNRDEYFEKRGGYVLNKMDRRMTGVHYSDALNYPITMPDGTVLFPGCEGEKQDHWNWRWSATKVKWGIENGFIEMKKSSGSWAVYFKQYEKVNNEDMPIVRSLPYQNLLNVESANSAAGTREVMNLLDGKYFDYPKPLSLILHIFSFVDTKDSTILDFFSGSATTAHAVMQLNAEDGGNRKFIMVQLPEATEEGSEAFKAGYKNICEIAKERIRRAGEKINSEFGIRNSELKQQQPGLFDDHEPRTMNHEPDVGFRVLKVVQNPLIDVAKTPNATVQQELALETIKEDATAEALLFHVLVRAGIAPSERIESGEICGMPVFRVGGGVLTAALEKGRTIDEKFLTALAEEQPEIAVLRDDAFPNDAMRMNAEQIFKQLSPGTKAVEVV